LVAGGKEQTGRQLVVLDTSVLLNFLRVGRLDLLVELPGHEFLVTDHVRGEVTDHASSQLLVAALAEKRLREERVDAPDEVAAFGQLTAVRTLGVGECAALAVAVCRRLRIAIDDKAARKKATAMFGFERFVGTADLVVSAIQSGIVDVVAADHMKLRWQTELRFHLTINSFRDLP
jgi:predicted nucleic acid-binding protein